LYFYGGEQAEASSAGYGLEAVKCLYLCHGQKSQSKLTGRVYVQSVNTADGSNKSYCSERAAVQSTRATSIGRESEGRQPSTITGRGWPAYVTCRASPPVHGRCSFPGFRALREHASDLF
jgi:hypothetical protein